MTGGRRYAPKYESSWALVVGINDYTCAPPLGYAVNDASGVVACLEPLGFPQENATLLTDSDATRERILGELAGLRAKVGSDDRVLFFFAGHGHTETGHRGEVGFLVPSDGVPANLQTLIRWDDLTRIAELIPAKHALFIMDACYGGLAVTRSAGGRQRFLKDILSRYVRQVLAAGKADQVVADSGGPRPENSVFTGHLLDALKGAASSEDGTITANGAMAYVYDRVGRDTESRQTPHYGCIDGDGDFVFLAPSLADLDETEGHGEDILVAGPPGIAGSDVPSDEQELTSSLKELIAEPTKRIKLDDVVMREVRDYLSGTGVQAYSSSGGSISAETFADRLQEYERAARRLMTTTALLGKWCLPENRLVLGSLAARLADNIDSEGGSTLLLALRWYPRLLVLYCGGIGAIASGSYENLNTLLTAQARDNRTGMGSKQIVLPVIDNLSEYACGFKLLSGHEQHYIPSSEYLFTRLQPLLEEALFLGRDYEAHFDRFEVFLAMVYAYLDGGGWAPLGRFAWKRRSRSGDNPVAEILKEAESAGADWAPLRAGLFGGDLERFRSVVAEVGSFLQGLNW